MNKIKGHKKPRMIKESDKELFFLRSKSTDDLYVHFRVSDKEYVMAFGVMPNQEVNTSGGAIFEEFVANELLDANPDLEKVKVKEVIPMSGSSK